jgi:hypothetical protein
MRPRLISFAVLLSVAVVVSAQQAIAASPPATGLTLHLSAPMIRPSTPFTVTGDKCPPPAGVTSPVAQLSLTALAVGLRVVPGTVTVPVAADGSWTAALSLPTAGYYQVVASCLGGAQAEGSYASYNQTTFAIVTQSVGYWTASANNERAQGFGDGAGATNGQPNKAPAAPITGVAGNPATGLGYWLAASDGGVFTFGDAYFQGSGAGDADRSPVVGVARYGFHTGRSYLLARADGSVTDYTPSGPQQLNGPLPLNSPIVGIAATPSEMGYYLVAADGGVFTFGDAHFAGSLGGTHLAAKIVGIAARADGGYWLAGGDGGVFTFGGAPFAGSSAGPSARVVGIAPTPDPLAPLQ